MAPLPRVSALSCVGGSPAWGLACPARQCDAIYASSKPMVALAPVAYDQAGARLTNEEHPLLFAAQVTTIRQLTEWVVCHVNQR